jgi:hypothetical protein
MVRRNESATRKVVWVCLGILSFLFGMMMVFFYPFKHPLREELGRSAVLVVPILLVQPFFGLWMLYQAIRHETKPLWYVLLAASVPFAYVWYYVERYRPRKLTA